MLRYLVFIALLTCVVGAGVQLRRDLIPDGRIVGGVETTIETFPYQVSLRYRGGHRCGGSVIKPDMILCAAHCVDWLSITDMEIVAGTSFRSKGGVYRKVKDYIMHDNWNSGNFDFDIAVILVDKPFILGKTIQSIPLPGVNEVVRRGTKAIVTGWGTLAEGGPTSDALQYVAVTIISNEQCAKNYVEVNQITDGMLCAGHPDGGRDACQGDSGGPLVIEGKVFGIVSWGSGCARADYPGVYSKVPIFRKWIDDQLIKLNRGSASTLDLLYLTPIAVLTNLTTF